MILGRSKVLWLSLVAAALNVAVIVFALPLTDVQVVTLNAFALAFLGWLANESDPTTVATFALTTTPPRIAPSSTTTVPASSPGTPSAGGGSAPTTGPTGGSG